MSFFKNSEKFAIEDSQLNNVRKNQTIITTHTTIHYHGVVNQQGGSGLVPGTSSLRKRDFARRRGSDRYAADDTPPLVSSSPAPCRSLQELPHIPKLGDPYALESTTSSKPTQLSSFIALIADVQQILLEIADSGSCEVGFLRKELEKTATVVHFGHIGADKLALQNSHARTLEAQFLRTLLQDFYCYLRDARDVLWRIRLQSDPQRSRRCLELITESFIASRAPLLVHLATISSNFWQQLERRPRNSQIEEFCKLMWACLPPLRDVIVETFTVIDHLGRNLPIPLGLCRYRSHFHNIIAAYCHASLGSRYILRRQYRLINNSGQTKYIDGLFPGASRFPEESGEIVELGIICRMRNAGSMFKPTSQQSCVRCKAQLLAADENVFECLRCGLRITMSINDRISKKSLILLSYKSLDADDIGDLKYFRLLSVEQYSRRVANFLDRR